MPRYFAKKATCALGHKHDSKREAARCAELVEAFRDGKIDKLTFHPVFEFVINGTVVTMANGHRMRFTADFGYEENGKPVIEDLKATNKYMSRDVPVKLAILRALHPEIEFRITK